MTEIPEEVMKRAAVIGHSEQIRSLPFETRVFLTEVIANALMAERNSRASLSSELDRLRDENASLRSGLSLQPISTADKDAERLTLGIVRNGVLEELHLGGFRYAINDDEVSCWWSDQCDDEIVPTHWMPAPLSPDNSTQKKEGEI